MSDAWLGPVDLYVIGLPSARPDPAALTALLELVDSGLLRLLDLVLVTTDDHGQHTITELAAVPDQAAFGIDARALKAPGLIGEDDVVELATVVPAGSAALIVAVELAYQRRLAARTVESGATLLGYERIPAPVVNALIDSLALDPEGLA
ncbi:DUF6325 family protein [Leucobacter luti]|uniref:DUF6325 family protein n=1 Tax=Leucobacter luti TaxID=340320 RepID=UPI001C68C217|nr:DUF6325 family protein [Leucobacter luti]QYM76847.1 hypothetical protein K1X41_05485 [Leucobacter luti]